MKYLALGTNEQCWPSKAILIPWEACETEPIKSIRKLARDLGDEIQVKDQIRGRFLYMPIVWEGNMGKETYEYLQRNPSKEENNLFGTIRQLVDNHGYYHRGNQHDWSDKAKFEYGGPPNPDHTIKQWLKNPDIEEFILLTDLDVGADKHVELSVRFYISPPEAKDALVEFMEKQLKFTKITVASTGDYGFAFTHDEALHRDLNKKVLKVPDTGIIYFDYVTVTSNDESNGIEDNSESSDTESDLSEPVNNNNDENKSNNNLDDSNSHYQDLIKEVWSKHYLDQKE